MLLGYCAVLGQEISLVRKGRATPLALHAQLGEGKDICDISGFQGYLETQEKSAGCVAEDDG